MKFERTVTISKSLLDKINRVLTVEPEDENVCFGEDELISVAAIFDNCIEIAVQCCGVQYKEGESNLAWTQAVMYDHGSEVRCTEPCEDFDGEWMFDYDGNIYVVNVCVEE